MRTSSGAASSVQKRPDGTGARRGRSAYQTAAISQTQSQKPRLTHFISLPLGHHPALRTRLRAFTDALQQSESPITGLHPSIVIDPRRVHLTLGVMSLFSGLGPTMSSEPKTLAAALALLQTLTPQIHSILDGSKLKLPLHEMGIFKPGGGRDKGKGNVLWLGPDPSAQESERLRKVCKLINEAFIKEGFIVDEKRPLKLHLTILNTTNRKPKPRNGRPEPFSYSEMLDSPVFQAIIATSRSTSSWDRQKDVVQVDFGTYDVDEIQICEMGSHGPDNEYVSCGGIVL